MGLLIEINHPGQVHLLKNVIENLQREKTNHVVIAKNEKSITDLLTHYQIPFVNIGTKGKGTMGKLLKQLVFTYRAFIIAKRNKLNIGVGSSFTNDLLTIFISNFKSIHLSDDDEEMVPFITKYSYPFATVILSPDCIHFKKFQRKVIPYAGYHELAYLHPNYFNPDPSIISELGLTSKDKYFVLRFVALKGHHDGGHKGISLDQKRLLINYLVNQGKVFITSENPIETEFEKYRIPITPNKIHSALFYATAFIGDSQTMTSEAAILGTPSFKCNTFAGKLSVPNELESKYNLCYSFQPEEFETMFLKIKSTINSVESKDIWKQKVELLLRDKIDVTSFILKYIQSTK